MKEGLKPFETWVHHYFLTKKGHAYFTVLHVGKITLPSTKKIIFRATIRHFKITATEI